MGRVRCPYCEGSTKRFGRTKAGSQRWRCLECGATFTRAIDGNSIGAIFASKAAYGMTDQPQPVPMAIKEDPLPPVEEVEARYLQPPKID